MERWEIPSSISTVLVASLIAFVAVVYFDAGLDAVYVFAAVGAFLFGSITVAALAFGAWRP